MNKNKEKKVEKIINYWNVIGAALGSFLFYYIGGGLLGAVGFGKLLIWISTIVSFFVLHGFLVQQENKRKAFENLAKK
jgi:hypothetical protein